MSYNLCCIANNLPSKRKYRTITYKSVVDGKKTTKDILEVYKHNFSVLNETIKYCASNKWGLRISSSLMPLYLHPKTQIQGISEIIPYIDSCRATIAQTGIRISMHPGQFCVLESDNETVVENTITELNWHGWLLDTLGLPRNYYTPINTHIYTSSIEREAVVERFIKNYHLLDNSVKTRLTVENNDKGRYWNCEGLIKLHQELLDKNINIPLCFDNLHNKCFPSSISDKDIFMQFYQTWNGCIPIFHHSESVNNSRNHADAPTFVPENYDLPVDFDVELKYKDYAIKALELLNKK